MPEGYICYTSGKQRRGTEPRGKNTQQVKFERIQVVSFPGSEPEILRPGESNYLSALSPVLSPCSWGCHFLLGCTARSCTKCSHTLCSVTPSQLSISLWHPLVLPFPPVLQLSLGMTPSGVPPCQCGASLCSAQPKSLMLKNH